MSSPTRIGTSWKITGQHSHAWPSALWCASGLGESAVFWRASEAACKYLQRARLGLARAASMPKRRARALALASGLSGLLATAASAAPGTSSAAVAVAPDVVSWPQGARISLELRRVPLSELLSMLSAQSGVRFRLATIPDVEVSVSLRDAPLPQAVRDLLAFHGFGLRAGPDAFWLVDAGAPAAPESEALEASYTSQAPMRRRLAASSWGSLERVASSPRLPSARSTSVGGRMEPWRWWTGATPPPPRWMTQNSAEAAYEGAPSKSGVPGVAPFGVRVQLQPPPPALARWKSGVHRFSAALPGAMPAPAEFGNASAASASANSSASATVSRSRWCARWPLFLRSVPTRCLLVIESERPANLYINGARLLHAWTGRRTLEVSGSLQPGSNLLALEWLTPANAAATFRGASSKSKPLSAEAPVVRYEWFVAQ